MTAGYVTTSDRCTCGHPPLAHVIRQGHVDPDAGRCGIAGCACRKFVPVGGWRPFGLAGEVGDLCGSCARPLNVNEPVYRGLGSSVMCAACKDAAPESASAANARAFRVDVQGMRTSELMKYAAADLRATALPGLRDRAAIVADALEARAAALVARFGGLERLCGICGHVHGIVRSCREYLDIGVPIGEVRS